MWKKKQFKKTQKKKQNINKNIVEEIMKIKKWRNKQTQKIKK